MYFPPVEANLHAASSEIKCTFIGDTAAHTICSPCCTNGQSGWQIKPIQLLNSSMESMPDHKASHSQQRVVEVLLPAFPHNGLHLAAAAPVDANDTGDAIGSIKVIWTRSWSTWRNQWSCLRKEVGVIVLLFACERKGSSILHMVVSRKKRLCTIGCVSVKNRW